MQTGMSQQNSVTSVVKFCGRESTGAILAKKSVKEKEFFDLTFKDDHMGRQKVPKSDIQSQFSMSKIIQIFLTFFSPKNISLGPLFLQNTFFYNFKIEPLLFLK